MIGELRDERILHAENRVRIEIRTCGIEHVGHERVMSLR